MRKLLTILFLIILFVTVVFAAYEDFTTYTEVDEDGDITVTATKSDVSTMRRDALSYVKYDYGASYFGDFEHYVDIHLGANCAQYSSIAIWSLTTTSTNNTIQDCLDNDDGFGVYIYHTNVFGTIGLYINDYTNDNSDNYSGLVVNTSYYLIVSRSGTTATCKIYSSSGRDAGDLVDTISITCNSTAQRYLFVTMSREGSTATEAVLDCYTENLDLEPSADTDEESVMGIF